MEDQIPKYRKSRKGRKPFTIEYRFKPDKRGNCLFGKDWTVRSRYRTEDQRDQALKALEVCSKYSEYRKGNS